MYCITLISRPDRRQAAERQFALVGLAKRVAFHSAVKDEENPERGIYHSHIACLVKGLEAGAQSILIFEDDVFFRSFSHARLQTATAFLRSSPHWDALFLGCLSEGNMVTSCESLVRVRFRCLCHAYALNRSYAQRIIQEPWQGIPFDTMVHRLGGCFFALRPLCAFQGLAASDNHTVWIERFRDGLGGLPRIQRCNEVYRNHKGKIVGLHILFAIILALFIYFRS